MTATMNIAGRVRELYERVRELDPGAYSGFVSDAAIRQVARETGENWRVVLKEYRASCPPRDRRGFPPRGARRPSREALAAAGIEG